MHYPGDVVAGAVLGAVSAWGVYKINALWRIKNQPKKTLSTP
jgi:membrane-associated phospholipid phosphatase